MDEPALTERVRAALREVLDPELGESIVDLGLVERIEVGPGRIEVLLIATSATCPMADLLVEDATLALQQALPGGLDIQVRLDADLGWTPTRMSPALRRQFGWPADAPDTP
jgi:metal-sulfur cluster biosynthetic enzyme